MVAAAGGRRRRGRETSAAAASCPLGHGAGRERQRREGEGEWRGSEWRGGAGPLHKHGKVAAKAAQTSHAARAGAHGGHASCSASRPLFIIFKILIPPRKYKLKSHFPPIISHKPIDYLLHRLHRCVGLQEYSNFP